MLRTQQLATACPSIDGHEQQHKVNEYFHRNASAWRRLYETQDVRSVIYQRRRDLVLDLAAQLGLPRGATALDIGCGAGFVSVALAREGYCVYAIDCVQSMLHQTRTLARESDAGGRVRALAAEGGRLPFKTASFSLVLAIGVLPWLSNPGAFLEEVHRVLRPDGAFVATSDNRRRLNRILDPIEWARAPVGRILRRLGLRKPGSSPQVHMLTLRETDADLLRAGFHKRFGATLGFGPFTIFGRAVLPNDVGLVVNGYLQALARQGAPLLRAAGSQYVFLATKE